MFHRLNETDLWSQTPSRMWVAWEPSGEEEKRAVNQKAPSGSFGSQSSRTHHFTLS